MKTKNTFIDLKYYSIFIINMLLLLDFSPIFASSNTKIFLKNEKYVIDFNEFDAEKLVDTIIISGCKDTIINSQENNCSQALVALSMNATTDCGISNDLNWTYALDFNNDGSINHVGTSNAFNQTIAYGTHKATWIVRDACGQQATCTQKVTVQDGRNPTVVCFELIGMLMYNNCSLDILAEEFVGLNLSSDNCPGPYTFTYDSLGLKPSYTFTKENYGINPITIYMHDAHKNVGKCETFIHFQTKCDIADPFFLPVFGQIKGINGQKKKGINVHLEQRFNSISTRYVITKTDINGHYSTDTIPTYYVDYKLYPEYNQELRNGLSILDIVSMQKHLLGIRTITDPYLLLAADVNDSGTYSVGDLIDLKKALLGSIDSFPSNQSFRFVRTNNIANIPYRYAGDYTFSMTSPLDFYRPYDFTMVKIGDLDQSFTLDGPRIEERSYPMRSLILPEKQVELGEEFVFKIGNTQDVIGMQGTLEFDPKKVEYIKVQSQTQQDNINTKSKENGQIGFITEEQTPVIEFVFKALQKQNLSEAFKFSNAQLPSLSVDKQLDLNKVQLAFAQENKKFEFDFDIYPNPMNETLNINCNYPSNESGSLVLYSMDGRYVLNKEIKFTAGFNHFTINLSDLQAGGLLILEIKTGQYVQQKKIFKTISK